MTRCIAHLSLVAALGAAAVAQEAVRGVLLDARTGRPVPGLTVWVPAEQRGTSSGVDGTFTLGFGSEVDPLLRIQGLGYRTLEVRLSDLQRSDVGVVIRVQEAPILMGETVVTAGRREQSLSSVPVSISTIGARDLSDRISVTLEEPLRSVSGVNIMDDQINIRGSSGYSRGVGSRVLLLLDGVPLLTGDTGEIIWEIIPVDQVERVEVVKGGGSALYGSSAMGGVINVIPSAIPPGTGAAVRLSGGVYEQPPFAEWKWSPRARRLSRASLLYSHGSASWGTLFSATRWMDESHRQNDVTHRYAVYSRTRVALSESWAVSMTGHYVHRKGGNFFWWKSLRSPLLPPEDYASRQVFSDRGFAAFALRGLHSSTSASLFRLQVYSNAWSDRENTVVTTESRSTRVLAEGQLTLALSDDHHVVTGATAYVDRVRSNIFGTHPGVGAAAFVQSDYVVFDRLDLSAGIRLDWQQVSGLASGSQVDPRIGAAYRMSDVLSLRASVGTGFRYPSIGELYTAISTGFGGVNVVPNPGLKPERSVSAEVGGLYQYTENGSVDLAVFHTEYDGLIEAAVDAQELVIRFDNVERARVQGVEVSGKHRLLDGAVSLNGGYTYVDPRDVGSGRILRFRPRHLGVFGITCNAGALSASAEYRYVSRVEAIDENLVAVAEIRDGSMRTDIHTVNLRARWTMQSLPLRVGCEVRNATNHQYVELLANLAPPRTYMIMLEGVL